MPPCAMSPLFIPPRHPYLLRIRLQQREREAVEALSAQHALSARASAFLRHVSAANSHSRSALRLRRSESRDEELAAAVGGNSDTHETRAIAVSIAPVHAVADDAVATPSTAAANAAAHPDSERQVLVSSSIPNGAVSVASVVDRDACADLNACDAADNSDDGVDCASSDSFVRFVPASRARRV